jgi:hypothetical protein
MATLREFLANRRIEIQAEIKSLRAELKELEAAEAALPEKTQPTQLRPNLEPAKRSPLTLKEMAIAALRENLAGLDANAIRREILSSHGLEIKRSSLSPQLSRLEKEGAVTRAGSIYSLAISPPSEGTPSTSESEISEGRTASLPGPGMP